MDAALAALRSARGALVSIADLSDYYEENQEYTEDAYTADSYAAYKEALAAAQEVLADADATQEEVDQALETLQAAVDGLTLKPDVEVSKEALQSLYDEYKDMEQGNYTDESCSSSPCG